MDILFHYVRKTSEIRRDKRSSREKKAKGGGVVFISQLVGLGRGGFQQKYLRPKLLLLPEAAMRNIQ